MLDPTTKIQNSKLSQDNVHEVLASIESSKCWTCLDRQVNELQFSTGVVLHQVCSTNHNYFVQSLGVVGQ
jgi:transposase